jgi:hypothetical protein
VKTRFERNPIGVGWYYSWQPLRRGAGYRAYDFPWHTQSIHDPLWRTGPWVSYIPGFTLRIIRNARVMDKRTLERKRRRIVIQFTSNGNGRRFICPGWW